MEQFLVLNDEIAALIRAGIPLELGLTQIAETATGGLSRLTLRLLERTQSGATLDAALAEEGDRIPGAYLAVIEAGRRAGQLPAALESVSQLVGKLLEFHRRAVLALVYPLIVLTVSYCLFVAFIWYFIPGVVLTYDSMRFNVGAAVGSLFHLRDTLWLWGPGLPAVALLTVFLLWKWSTRQTQGMTGCPMTRRLQALRWVPWLRQVHENYDYGAFCRILSLLVEHATPLHEAILLAACSTGNPRIVSTCSIASERLREGQPVDAVMDRADGLPPFLRWMICSGAASSTLDATLRQARAVYEHKAEHQVEWARVTLPAVLTVGIGGTSAFLYAVALFAPILEMYERLAEPVMRV